MEDRVDNAREFTRVDIELSVQIQAGDTIINTDHTKDLSMKGIFVVGDSTLPAGTKCQISLFLQGLEEEVQFEVTGKVCRETAEGMAIEFTELTLEGYEHLQNLVRYNSHDVDTVDNELKSHIGLKKKE